MANYVAASYQVKMILILSITAILAGVGIYMVLHKQKSHQPVSSQQISSDMRTRNPQTPHEVVALFPQTVDEFEKRTKSVIEQTRAYIENIIALPAAQRTFQNTFKALDDLTLSDFELTFNTAYAIQMVHPDEVMRNAGQMAVKTLQEFSVDEISNNKALYLACKAYVDGRMKDEQLTDEERYYITETMKNFERAGLNLPDEKLNQVKQIKKELADLSLKFNKEIAADNRTISVSKEALAGMPDDFVAQLKQDDNGLYIVGVDYPTYFSIMENCTVTDTRKKLYRAFMQRAYPANESILKAIVQKRTELAELLGYDTYADLDLSNQMVESVSNARTFLTELMENSSQKAEKEFQELIKELPESVILSESKLQPWDVNFVQNQYKKQKLNVDELKIAEYFPMEQTVESLLEVYRQFLGVDFKQVPVSDAWHDDVRLISVYRGSDKPLGYLLLDLHPRPNKYSHACHMTIIPAVFDAQETPNVAVSLVIANFAKPTADKPSLLKRNQVNTFFHEFGHALHALLGRTHIASFSGTSVKSDFVEMPSQMLEEWLWDREILRMVSNHYQTNESLPDELIDAILQLKNFNSGAFIRRQAMLSFIALDLFNGVKQTPHELISNLYSTYISDTVFDPYNHMYASFGHLDGYGAKYYGYMWSKVFALDLFNEIKKIGLLNPQAGQKYIDLVIGRGGSKHPKELLIDFLGREPNQKAFLADLGLTF